MAGLRRRGDYLLIRRPKKHSGDERDHAHAERSARLRGRPAEHHEQRCADAERREDAGIRREKSGHDLSGLGLLGAPPPLAPAESRTQPSSTEGDFVPLEPPTDFLRFTLFIAGCPYYYDSDVAASRAFVER